MRDVFTWVESITRTLWSKEQSGPAGVGYGKRLFGEGAHRAKLVITLLNQLIDRYAFKLANLGVQGLAQGLSHHGMIVVSPTLRLGHNLINQSELPQVFRRDLERRGRLRSMVLISQRIAEQLSGAITE